MTLRELIAMCEAKERSAWQRTAAVLALIANCHRDPHRSRAFTPADFLPDNPARESLPPTADLTVLKSVFVDRHQPEKRP
jgi:hypothetical protein